MEPRDNGFWERLKANRPAYTLTVLATLTIGILIGTVISKSVRGQEGKHSSDSATPLTIPSPQQLSNQFSQISKQLEPTVVNINTESTIKNPHRRRGGPDQGGGDEQNPFDDFFDRLETEPVKSIWHDPQAVDRYKGKRFWQSVHKLVCKTFGKLCGAHIVTYRSRETGAYEMRTPPDLTPVSYDESVDQSVVDADTAAAIDFLKRFAQGKCVILTMVPSVETKIAKANAIANGLGTRLVTPGILEGLKTKDGYHLDQPSAERWSQAFFQAAGPEIRSCLGKQGVTHP